MATHSLLCPGGSLGPSSKRHQMALPQTQGREGRGRAPGCRPGSPMLHLKGTQGSAHGGRRAQELPSLVGSPTVPSVCQRGGPDPDLGCCQPGAARSLYSGLGERKNGSREWSGCLSQPSRMGPACLSLPEGNWGIWLLKQGWGAGAPAPS